MAMDRTVRFSRSSASCRVVVRRGALRRLGALARRATNARRVVVVTDPKVAALYGARALASLRAAGLQAHVMRVPRGERAKQPSLVTRLWEEFDRRSLGRRDLVVALGGGVVGDVAGFAAATWLRGIAWIGVPTTLLAQVDSSIGGKTGIDLSSGKNLAGAFHQPSLVLADPETLRTLPRRQLRSGLAELVKTGMATDAALFRWAERRAEGILAGDPALLLPGIERAVRAKLRVVGRDEREREGGSRTALNFGHTLGHAIEAAAGYRSILHGEAIAVGMRAAAELSERLAGLEAPARARLETLLDRLGLPRRMPALRLERLLQGMARDKKRGSAGVRWVLTPRVGHASVPRPVEPRLVRSVLKRYGALS